MNMDPKTQSQKIERVVDSELELSSKIKKLQQELDSTIKEYSKVKSTKRDSLNNITKEIFDKVKILMVLPILYGRKLSLGEIQKETGLSWGYIYTKIPLLVDDDIIHEDKSGKIKKYETTDYGIYLYHYITEILPHKELSLKLSNMIDYERSIENLLRSGSKEMKPGQFINTIVKEMQTSAESSIKGIWSYSPYTETVKKYFAETLERKIPTKRFINMAYIDVEDITDHVENSLSYLQTNTYQIFLFFREGVKYEGLLTDIEQKEKTQAALYFHDSTRGGGVYQIMKSDDEYFIKFVVDHFNRLSQISELIPENMINDFDRNTFKKSLIETKEKLREKFLFPNLKPLNLKSLNIK